MAVRVSSAAAVFTAAVAVSLLVRARCRRLRREAVAERLVAGRAFHDNDALCRELEALRCRVSPVLSVSESLIPPLEGGPR
jgi:hypothetical protein